MPYLKLVFAVRFIYETEQFNGTGELLEILGRHVQFYFIDKS